MMMKARSGIGLSLRGQTYARLLLSMRADVLARVSGSADIYRQSDFNDLAVNFEIGPQFRSGMERLSVSPLVGWRWYGMAPYSSSYGASANWVHPAGKRGQLRVDASYVHEDNKRNDLENSDNYSLAVAVDRAFGARFGGGVQMNALREVARDPGYSTIRDGINLYLFRELGKTTAVLNLGYSRLEADESLFLHPERRKDDGLSASLSATFRSLKIGIFSPLARIKYETNRSTIDIYDFNLAADELGITAAF